jgi:ethanolamine utilization protein EutM
MIETWEWVPAIVAADAASKAAVVSLLGYELARAGLITVKMVGDVAAVKAAVAAGAAAAEKVGRVVAVHVIPRPSSELWKIQPGPNAPVRAKESVPSPAPPTGRESGQVSVTPAASENGARLGKVKKGNSKSEKPAKLQKPKPKGRGKRGT